MMNDKLKEIDGIVNRASKSVADKLKNCFKTAGASDVNDLDFSKLDLSGMSGIVGKMDCQSMSGLNGQKATDVLDTSSVSSFSSSFGNILGDKNAELFK